MIKQCVAGDEPYFLLRGKDICALPAIEKYYEVVKNNVTDPYFIEEIEEIMKDFRAFLEEQETHIPD
jgi:predicted molibdopterin-dependent oxidoreductase YjgC